MLRDFPDNHFGSCVTDPPYGLSAPPDIRVVLRAWLDGETYEHGSKGFMGREWDSFVPSPEVWSEVFRVMKPGAFLVCFAGQRTVDLMGISLRLAGFELRDLGGWLYWSGFPKSLDVSKAFDADLGAEREVVGMKVRPDGTSRPNKENWSAGTMKTYAQDAWTIENMARGGNDITAPASPEAIQWSGFGTALKPASEPFLLARKPLEGTYVQNLRKWGVGALNIDACRYAYGDKAWPGPQLTPEQINARHGHCAPGREDGVCYGWGLGQESSIAHELGRWPSNIYACPKASRSEREAGLTAENMLCSCKPEQAWESEDRSQSTTSAKGVSTGPDTTGSIGGDGSSWPTDGPGSSTTVGRSRQGTISTTSTGTPSTIESRTSSSLTRSPTSGSTAAANSATVSGGSRADAVAGSSRSERQTGTSAKRAGPSMGDAAHATSGSSSKASGAEGSACERCGKRKRATTGAEATGRKADSAGLNSPRTGAGRTSGAVLNAHPT